MLAAMALPEKTPDIEVDQAAASTRFRYASAMFYRNLVTAAVMTILLCLLVWMITEIAGYSLSLVITGLFGLTFFAFISARSVHRFLTNEIVMSVTPSGLFDARVRADVIGWDEIRDLAVSPREGDAILKLVLWERGGESRLDNKSQYTLDLTQLDSGPTAVLEAISRYRQIRYEFDSQSEAGR